MQDELNYLVIGQGAIGVQVSNQLAKLGYRVTGMARKERANYSLAMQAHFLQADATQLSAKELQVFSHIAIIVTASEYSEQGYQDSYLAIAQHIASLQAQLPKLQRLVFVSSTGIYGQQAGEWIDEHTQPKPAEKVTSQIIYQAEQVLQNGFVDKCTIVRASGIYGTDRQMRLRQAKKADKAPMAEYAWTNRIMDTDLVNIITKVMTIATPKPLYLATDYQPCTSYELTSWLCHKLHTPLPVVDGNISESGKRIHSNIPLEWLTYPDWQAGYQHILQTLEELIPAKN